MNAYRNKYSDLYPCLAENCAKGVSNAVVLERGTASENKVDKLIKQLETVNDKDSIITMRAPRLTQTAYDDLAGILTDIPISSPDSLNMVELYQKYGYTFAPIFGSKYFCTRLPRRFELHCGIPMQEKLLRQNLHKIIGEPVKTWSVSLGINADPNKAKSNQKIYVDSEEEKMLAGILRM